MPKKNEKTREIRVTARFEVDFTYKVSEEDFARLKAEEVEVDDVVDETHAYHLAATEGTCEMDWDYSEPKPKKAKKK